MVCAILVGSCSFIEWVLSCLRVQLTIHVGNELYYHFRSREEWRKVAETKAGYAAEKEAEEKATKEAKKKELKSLKYAENKMLQAFHLVTDGATPPATNPNPEATRYR